MARLISYRATKDDAGKRLDVVLGGLGQIGSRSRGAQACEAGHVLLGGAPAVKKQEVSEGDLIIIELEDEGTGLVPEPIPLDIRYEDDHLLVLSKPPGLITHPSPDHPHGTLASALLYRYGEEGLSHVQGEDDRPGIVHRLDGDTSGLMLAAKTDEAGYALMDAIATKAVDRRYLALVHGRVTVDSGMVDASIERHAKERTRMAVGDGPTSREAITTFKVLEHFEAGPKDQGYSLLECKLYTGRTHQIRVHMQYIKHPIVGDATYTANAPKQPSASLGLDRQFLHSYRISFAHPVTGEEVILQDGLPEDLQGALDGLANRSSGRTGYGEEVLEALKGEEPCISC